MLDSETQTQTEHAEGSFNRTSILAVVIGFLAICIDGFDNYVISYAAPYITVDWGIVDKAIMGPIFSAALVGAVVGAIAAGYGAARIGARTVVIACCFLLAIPSVLIAFSTSISQLIVLRLLVGLGVGGLQPVLLALTSEHVPAKYRATMVTIMWSGITVGAVLAGVAGTWFMPHFGWHSTFLIGGACAIVVGALCVFILPEAPSFLAGKTSSAASTRMSLKASWILTFKGRLAAITPLLWILHGGLLVAYYAIGNWLPTLLGALGRPPSNAGSFGMIFQIGGTIGGIAMSWLIDRGRLAVMGWAVGCAIPLVALIGFVVGSDALLYLTVFAAGFAIISVQFSSNAVATMVYPAHVRSSAMGLYFVSGRGIGAVGPLLISLGLTLGIPSNNALAIVCIPLALALIAAIGLGRFRDDVYGASRLARA